MLRARSSQRGNLDVPSDQAVVITLWFEMCIGTEVRFRPCTSFLISQSLTWIQYMNYVKNDATTWRIPRHSVVAAGIVLSDLNVDCLLKL